jgi:hypothetical protein
MGRNRPCAVLVIGLLLSFTSVLGAAGQDPNAALLLIQIGTVPDSRSEEVAALGLNVLADHGGIVTVIATQEQLDLLRLWDVDAAVLDDRASTGRYYLLPADDPAAAVVGERALATFPQATGHLLLKVDPECEELLWRRSTNLKRLFGHLPWPRPEQAVASEVAPSYVLVREMVDQVSRTSLSKHVRSLQDHDSLPGWDALRSRYSLSPQLDVERAYVGQHFADLGLQVEYHPFTMVGPDGSVQIFNVVATHPGVDAFSDDVCILCAHYDSTASRTLNWNWETDPAPGADDNASGAAAVMEAARVLSQYEFSDTIRFIAFAGEEQGLWGSSAYAADAWAAGDDISAVINLDMIGYNPACDKVDFLGDPASDWLVNAIRTNASEYYVDIITEKIISASFTYSDHSSFWDYGYPAILGIEDYQPWSDSYCYEANENYHKVTDTFDAMNLSLLEKTTQLAVATIAELAGPGSVGTARTLYLPVVFPQWTPPGPVP